MVQVIIQQRIWFWFSCFAVVWTLCIGGSLAWNLSELQKTIIAEARIQAMTAWEKDVLYRRWNAAHGGVYVPISAISPPNPYLSVAGREIQTDDGRRLTLINPAYMTRQVHELGKQRYGVQGHITSLNPIRPGNAPDPWEREQLQWLTEHQQQESSQVSVLGGQPYLRYIRVLKVEQSCMKCHATQGYKVGQVRGGISASVPMQSYYQAHQASRVALIIGHIGVWGIGLVCLGLGARQINRSGRQLRRKSAELSDALSRAEAATQAKTQFLANMSHEIRTPLTAVLGFADLLREQNIDSVQRREYADLIRSNGDHLLHLINDILDVSRIESGKVDIQPAIESLSILIHDVLMVASPRAGSKGLSVDVVFSTPVPERIWCDITRLRQILLNLMINAIKFTSVGWVRIVLSCQSIEIRDRVRLQIAVEDTGIGIARHQLDRLFEPFAQLDPSASRQYGGTGLGLVICKRLADRMGGELSVSSTPGKGSRFVMDLPMRIDPDTEWIQHLKPIANANNAAQVVTQSRQWTGHVLLAEDSMDNRRLIAYHLRRVGVAVDLADDGRQAIERVQQSLESEAVADYDLVFMDLQMPEVDGLAATTCLREMGCRCPIVALTAHAMSSEAQRCFDVGMNGFLTKPLNLNTMYDMLDRYLKPVGNASDNAPDAPA